MPPTDFDLYVLNAILALPCTMEDQSEQGTAPPIQPDQIMKATPQQQSVATCDLSRVGRIDRELPSTRHVSDKLFPVPLLKCPLHVFQDFCTNYSLHPDLISELRSARRRKANRKHQRITRNRRVPFHDHVAVESDDEGQCDTIDSRVVYNQLVMACNSAAKAMQHQSGHWR